MKHALTVACSSCNGCAPPFLIEKNEELPKEILDKIPKEREKKGYEIVRSKDEENQTISLEDLFSNEEDSKKTKKEDTRNKKKRKRRYNAI